MNREKLNEAAISAAEALYCNLSDPDVSADGRTEAMYASMFESGVDWLMSQPLSERLTEEEKEMLRAEYKQGFYPVKNTLIAIFGYDLFNNKSE